MHIIYGAMMWWKYERIKSYKTNEESN